LIVDLLGVEKEEEYHKKILNFPHSEQMKSKTKECISDMQKKINHGQEVVKAVFEQQDKTNSKFSKYANFTIWENIKKNLQEKAKNSNFLENLVTQKTSLQELANIPWDFMDRAYSVGIKCLQEKKYADGECVFMFLRFLCPSMFEYWVGEATCQQQLGRWEDAMNTYFVSLVFKPKNSLVFFQIANCCYRLNLKDNFKNALDLCIEYAGDDKTSEPLASLAKQMRQSVAA
jgi:hypothetical protein